LALRYVNQPDVKALFEELRGEEADHVRMLEEIIARLPPSAAIDLEDEDAYPDNEENLRQKVRQADKS
jgi:rubrerythrin